jgi:DNA-binding response OmpR family regulator
MRLLVVEDEPDPAEGLRVGLSRTGYAVDVAGDAAQAFDRLTVNEYDLMLLDVNLPDGDGFTFCRSVRTGYLVKPFHLAELLTRVRALLRRDTSGTTARLTVGAIVLDVARHPVTVGGEPVALTRKEFSVLEYLMTRPGQVESSEDRCRARVPATRGVGDQRFPGSFAAA